MITAKDFWNNACKNDELKSPADIMIEFAKMHLATALKQASERADITDNGRFPIIDKPSILNSYPLENIK